MFDLLQETVQPVGLENPGYNELPRTGHWFDGIMTYGPMGSFLSRFFEKARVVPQLGPNFTVVTGNPGAMTSRGGVRTVQLLDPGMFSRMNVEIETGSETIWNLVTSNIRRFEIDLGLAESRTSTLPSKIAVDGNTFSVPRTRDKVGFLLENSQWAISNNDLWKRSERHGLQLGGLQAILNTKSIINILTQGSCELSRDYHKKAIEISRNLFQYYSADTEIGPSENLGGIEDGNIVIVGKFDKSYLPVELQATFPISQAEDGSITIRLQNGEIFLIANQPAIGMIFIFPLGGRERVGVLVWGSDTAGLRRAARLFPIRTGVCQPDFIILGPESGWKGAAGALALGLFDSHWQIQASSSYFRR
ncbi:hypothetical protein ABW20_dc0102959 [Dactylellina cionopaga]|nr:hypothetical protein ABW20_dc0102959 [Dactylellina cionopaga]